MEQIIIGALLGILGSLGGISFQTRMTWQHDRKTRRLEKLEELLSLANACMFSAQANPLEREGYTLTELHKTPEMRMLALADLYFPELHSKVSTLNVLAITVMANNIILHRNSLTEDEMKESKEKYIEAESRMGYANLELAKQIREIYRRIDR